MYRSNNQKLTDEIIGEAVLALLHAKGPVTTKALIAQLQSMESHASDAVRREAIIAAIADVRSSLSEGKRNEMREQQNRDNVHSLFGEGDKKSSGSSKKH